MRKLLAAAVALAPLAIAAGAAHADTEISNTRTTPILTANANNGAADNVVIANGGTLRILTGVAATLNSDNDITIANGGLIQMEDADDGATAILAEGGNSGSIEVNGLISITEDYTAKDEDEDGDLDGPFAIGSDRYGIRVVGAEALDGDILVGRQGAITVEGNNSYGIFNEAGLTGDLVMRGSVTMTGDGSYAIRSTGDVAGDVWVGGAITARGENAVGVSLEGDIGGSLRIDGNITVTGFRYTGRSANQEAVDALDEDDLLIGGPAVRISGNVAGGVLLATTAPPADDDDDEDNPDRDGDGVPDSEQTTAAITSFGSAPAIEIGSETRDITLGLVGTGELAYGFINRGGVTASGVYDGVEATGIQVGVAGGNAVTIEGGFKNEGGVEARSREAAATAVRFGDGVTTPILRNSGTILGGAVTDGDHDATAILVEAGASLPSLYNSGRLQSVLTGPIGDAVTIRDLSGTLTQIDNIGVIQATTVTTRDENGEVIPTEGQRIAIDVSANTTGVTLTQLLLETDPENPPANGITSPVISGDILLGSGADIVDIRDGFVFGNIDFGSGADSLLISGDAEVRGALSATGGLLSIDVSSGLLDAQQTTSLDISSLSVGADGNLILTIDPASGTSGGFNVSGTASFADGAGLGARFVSLVNDPTRYVVIEAGVLEFGDIDETSLIENSPFLFVVEAGADEAAGQVYLDVRRRTADEIGMIQSESAAFDAVYNALNSDEELRNAFLTQNGRDGLMAVYEQMLPDHSGGALISLASGVDAVTRALAGRNNSAARGETSAWLQEINFYADKETDNAYGFKSEGFGFAGGVERGTAFGAIGVSTAFTSSDLEEPGAAAEERLSANLIELGLYWRAQGGAWTTWARAAGGYASFESVRQFVGEGILRRAEADWNGYTVTVAAGASYERSFGRYSLRPEVLAEYFALSEDGFEETGGGDGFNLAVEDRDGHIFSTTAALNFGMGFGENQWLRPELRVGWRQIISHDGGVTTARFLSGGPGFDLMADSLEGGGPIIGLRLNVGNELGMLAVEADAEFLDDYVRYALLLRASFRF
ncbi:autotransporter domain-containing protein [Brevundimonas sp.]|uniref:autotransporter outer membrane beta-barrel domain-containing protein n=1 Tax=Brevundimonas sp. TaxID=1871086 RepID=UPI001D743860|nr:autotransporter domain-containing protein [Brevundimonas sp.]MBA3999166.1 autotransporter outer membrane beta-barrel domain-containing protein [Brevundimonas sp.]